MNKGCSITGTFSHFTPNIKECWWIFFYTVVVGQILATPTVFFHDIPLVSKALSYLLMFVPPILYCYFKGKKGMERDGVKINRPHFGRMNPVLFFVVISCMLFATTVVIDPIAVLFPTPEWFANLMEEAATGGNPYVSALTVCIFAPLCEEFICRGMMTRGLLARGTSPTVAILWSAFFFGILHLNPWQAIPAFILGALFGWVYYITGSLWATIWLHALNNTTSTLLFTFLPDIPANATLKDILADNQLYLMVFAIATGILALSYFIINKYVITKHDNHEETIVSA